MGIQKIGPKLFRIKARVKIRPHDPRLPVDDRRVREVFSGTEAQAQDRYLEIKRGLRGERAKVKTFGDILTNYRESRGGEVPRSQRSIFETLLRDLGHIETPKLEGALRQYAILLARMPSKATGELLAVGTRNRFRAMVSVALNLAVELKDIPAPSPLTKAIWPKPKEIPRDRRLTPEELTRLMDVVRREAPHLENVFWYALRVPCRKSELVRMGPADLDLFNDLIRVWNGSTKNEAGVWKPIPEEMKLYFRSIPAGCPYLFYREVNGGFRRLGDFKKSWGRCLRLAGIGNFRFHDTRHISATNLINAGMSERDVMKIAGWSTNMLSTYWNSSSTESAKRAKFVPGVALLGGNAGATFPEVAEKRAENGVERAVS